MYRGSSHNSSPALDTLVLLIQLVHPAALNTEMVLPTPATLVGSEAFVDKLTVERAIGSLSLAVLLHHVGVEHIARKVFLPSVDAVLVLCRLSTRIRGADLRVERPGEELGSNVASGLVDSAAIARLGRLVTVARRWRSVVGLLIAVGANNDRLEILTPVSEVGSSLSINTRAPESAFEVGDRARIRAVLSFSSITFGGVLRWVALYVNVKAGAESRVVAPFGTPLGVVAAEGVQTEIGVSAYGGVEVFESVLVGLGSDGLLGELMEWGIINEGIHGVWHYLRAIAIWLRSTGILRIDEATLERQPISSS